MRHAEFTLHHMLLNAVVQGELRRKGAWSARFHRFGSDATISDRILNKFGFLPRGGYRLMTKLQDERLEAIVRNQANWNYSFGDSEASHTLE